MPIDLFHDAIVPAKGEYLGVGHHIQPLAEGRARLDGVDDVRPGHVQVHAGEVLGQDGDLAHPGHPRVEEVNPGPGELLQDGLQVQRIGVDDAVQVAGLQAGVKDHRQPDRVGAGHQLEHQIILQGQGLMRGGPIGRLLAQTVKDKLRLVEGALFKADAALVGVGGLDPHHLGVGAPFVHRRGHDLQQILQGVDAPLVACLQLVYGSRGMDIG